MIIIILFNSVKQKYISILRYIYNRVNEACGEQDTQGNVFLYRCFSLVCEFVVIRLFIPKWREARYCGTLPGTYVVRLSGGEVVWGQVEGRWCEVRWRGGGVTEKSNVSCSKHMQNVCRTKTLQRNCSNSPYIFLFRNSKVALNTFDICDIQTNKLNIIEYKS